MANGLKTALLLGVLSGLLLLIGDSLGGRSGLVTAFGFAVVMNFASYWFSDKIVLMMYRAQPVGAEHPLYRVTERLAQRAGLPMPKVYVIPDMSPNAFATGRNPSHAAVAATMGAAIMMLARMAQFAAVFGGGGRDDDNRGGNPIGLLATVILAPIAAMLIQAAISRSREFGADRGGAEIAGAPYGLVDALKKLEFASKRIPMDASPATAHMMIMKPFSVHGMLSLFSTHPPTEARVRALLGQA